MKLEEIVNELYRKYEVVSRRKKKIEAVKEVARRIGIRNEDLWVTFNPYTEEAELIIYCGYEWVEKLEEIASWLSGKVGKKVDWKIEITTAELGVSNIADPLGFADAVGIEFKGVVVPSTYEASREREHYYLLTKAEHEGITVNVYLILTTYEEEDC